MHNNYYNKYTVVIFIKLLVKIKIYTSNPFKVIYENIFRDLMKTKRRKLYINYYDLYF